MRRNKTYKGVVVATFPACKETKGQLYKKCMYVLPQLNARRKV